MRMKLDDKGSLFFMQKERIKVDDNNRSDITGAYCYRVLQDMDADSIYSLAYSMLKDSKSGLTNEQLENQIVDYYPDILED